MLYYNMCMCMFSTFIYHYVSIVRSIEPTGILGLEINIIIIINPQSISRAMNHVLSYSETQSSAQLYR